VFVSAILLAAGESTRMGRQKALIPWEGTSLLEYQLAQLRGVEDIREIVVVTGHEPDRVTEIARASEHTRAAHNAEYQTGKASSVRVGVREASKVCDAFLLLAVDQPRPASLLCSIIDAHIKHRALITVPTHGGHRGHPVVFSADIREELAVVRDEKLGVRDVLQQHSQDVFEIDVADAVVLLDLNSPSDLPA
jgi:molybdenum cofactor cytidylyltransferase